MLFRISATVLVLSLISVCTGLSQVKPRTPASERPGRTVLPLPKTQMLPDSAHFVQAFSALWPLMKPQQSIRTIAERRFRLSARSLLSHNVDTGAAYATVRTALDTNIDRTILMVTFIREGFTADDLSALAAFWRTPAGEKFRSSEQRLFEARNSELEKYVQRLFQSVVAPLMKPVDASRQGTGPAPILRDSTLTPRVPVLDTAKHRDR
jgi:hypothetical protein